MCLIPAEEDKKKQELIQTVENLITPNKIKVIKLEEKKLAYPVKTDNYLVLYLETSPKTIVKVEQFLQQQSFVSQYLLKKKEANLKVKKRPVKSSNESTGIDKKNENTEEKETQLQ